MACSSVAGAGLGVCRGYFASKSLLIRQLTSVSNEASSCGGNTSMRSSLAPGDTTVVDWTRMVRRSTMAALTEIHALPRGAAAPPWDAVATPKPKPRRRVSPGDPILGTKANGSICCGSSGLRARVPAFVHSPGSLSGEAGVVGCCSPFQGKISTRRGGIQTCGDSAMRHQDCPRSGWASGRSSPFSKSRYSSHSSDSLFGSSMYNDCESAPAMEVSSGARASSLRSKEDTFSSEARLRANAAGNGGGLLLEDDQQTENRESFVEVGYVANTHGLQGELHVHSLTDFPEERFEKPGFRWLRTRSMGRPSFQQVELLKGRAGPGKRPSWLITLKNVNTPEKASELVGATMLVAEEDKRLSLDADEFYVPDLVGMTVALQESGEEIGVVLNVFSTGGGHDLLQVSLVSATDEGESRKIWVPFVTEIVPVVDKELRRIEIAPPQGLLELNGPAKGKDEKDSNKKEFKERRKLRGKLGGLKKRLKAMGQTHILAGLSAGTKEERDALLEQLLSIDFGILQQALDESLVSSTSSARPSTSAYPPEPPPAFPKVNWQQFDSWVDSRSSSTSSENVAESSDLDMKRWWSEGLQLVADGKVAVVALAGGQSTRLGPSAPPVKGMVDVGLPDGKSLFHLQAERLLLVQELASLVVDPEFTPFIPWIIMTSDATDAPTRQYFLEKNFFGLDESQVWFIKQDSMPCVSRQSPEGRYDVLMETPWKIAQAPNGNGGLFSALHADGTIDRLVEDGIEFVQVYAIDNALVRVSDPVFFGYTKDRGADVGVKVVTKVSPEEAVGVVCLQKDGCIEDEEGLEDSVNRTDREPSSASHYGVLEYSEMPEELRHAHDESGEPGGSPAGVERHDDGVASTSGERRLLRFRAAHICVNIFSVDYLKRLGESGFEFKFHSALKRIPHAKQLEEEKEWVRVVPDAPNGMKLELYVFDAFQFCDEDKVALLEVHREEEFAPVKNAAGPGVPDTVDTARELVLGLQRRLSECSFSEPPSPRAQLIRNVLVAYLGGHVEKDVLELLKTTVDERLSQ